MAVFKNFKDDANVVVTKVFILQFVITKMEIMHL